MNWFWTKNLAQLIEEDLWDRADYSSSDWGDVVSYRLASARLVREGTPRGAANVVAGACLEPSPCLTWRLRRPRSAGARAPRGRKPR